MHSDVSFGSASLGEVAELVMGSSPPGESYNETGNGLPLINGPAEYGPRNPIPVKWTTAATRICKTGDVLICVRGNTTGRLNVADQEYCIGRGVAAIRAKPEKCAPAFLWWILERHAPRILAAATGAGTTFPNINKPQLAALPIPWPPVSEQRAIAQVLDAAHAAIERTREAIAKARRVKRGVIRAFLDRMKATPTRLGSFITDIRYGTSQASNNREWGYPTLRIPNIIGGKIDLADLTFVDAPEKDAEWLALRPGDLLLVRTNGNPAYVGRLSASRRIAADGCTLRT